MESKNNLQEERETMCFLDENGEKVEFEAVARIYLNEKEYLLLSPLEDENSDNLYAFRIDKIEDKEELNLVDDDKEFLAVKKEYKKLLY